MKVLKKIVIITIVLYIGITFACSHIFTYDKVNATNTMANAALDKSHNCCALAVAYGIFEGGKPCILILPAFAYSYYLPLIGFDEIKVTKDYKPQIGDVVVFPRVKGHIFGHIAMYDGEQWISDFKQKSIYVSKAYRNTKYRIFRVTKNYIDSDYIN